MKFIPLLLSALLLSACGSSSAPDSLALGFKASRQAKAGELSAEVNRRCQSLAAGAGAVAFAADEFCPNCSADDAAQAADGTDETYASLKAGLLSPGTLTLRATAPSGTVFPEGSNAAVTLSAEPENFTCSNGVCVLSSNTQNWRLTVRTYLDGNLQQEESQGISIDNDPDSRQIYGLTATLPFNAIEAAFDRIGIYADGLPQSASVNFNGSDYVEPGNAQVHEFCGDFDLTGLQ